MGRIIQIQGTYGFCTIIVDSVFYDWITSKGLYSEKNLYRNGAISDFGNEFLSATQAYTGKLKYTLLQNLVVREYDATAIINVFKNFVSDITYSQFFLRQQTIEPFNAESQTSLVRLTPDTAPFGGIKTRFSIDGTTWVTLIGQSETVPYGAVDVRSSYANAGFVIPVYNDDMSSIYTIIISTASDSLSVNYYVLQSDTSGVSTFTTWLNGIPPYDDTADPYNTGGNTDPSPKPPTGDFDNTSDPIDVSQLPTLSAVDTRFISLFKPDLSQLQSLASYMWGANFDLETFKKLFNDPMAAILGLSIVPVVPPTAAAAPITLGNITTTISMPKITSQFVQVPCGTLNVNEYWGAYLDYSPFTKLEIYLPYIGVQTLDADDIMGRSVEVVYNIDVLSGACVAQLKCGDSVLYSFAGSCAVSIPITGRDWTNMINGIIGVATAAAGIAVAGATGGASVAAAAAGGALSQTANSLSSMKPTVQKSGTMAAGSGMLAIQKPYLILTRPRQALPENQNKYTGYPSFITATLGDLTGMTYVYEIHLENIDCTQAEQAEIETLLKNGVIL